MNVLKMIKLEFTTEQVNDIRYNAYHHPHPHVQRKMNALSMKNSGIHNKKICSSLGISENTLRAYFKQYQKGGVDELSKINFYKPTSTLNEHQATLKEYFDEHPPFSVKEASHTIHKLTGIQRGITQTRAFMKSIGLKRLKTGTIPAKADHDKQTEFHNDVLQPLLEEAKENKKAVYFVDSVHFIHSLFLAFVWCFSRVFVQAPSKRSRFNVLGAINAITHKLVTITNNTYITATTVCELLEKLAKMHTIPITLILDNARYQRCEAVISLALKLNIELIFLPTYSPNLNLIERLWKFVKKKCLNGRYYSTFTDFTKAITDCLDNLPEYEDELKSLLSLKFQDLSGNNFKKKSDTDNNKKAS